MARTEEIEARLAAYVDGELGEKERAEIETHLAANPTHRALLEDLARHRDLLRQLPRESSPADVADAVTAQLERAVLLGDVDGEAETGNMRIDQGNWVRFRAIAAVLLLTASLTAVIVALLPSSNQHPAELAQRVLPANETDQSGTALANDGTAPAALSVAPAPAPATPAQVATPPVLVMGNREQTTDHIFREVVQPKLQGELHFKTSGGTPIVYFIPTDNPDATNQAVTRYLASNGISWETQNDAMSSPSRISAQQVVYASRLQQQKVQLESSASMPSDSSSLASGTAADQPPRGVWAGGGAGTFTQVQADQRIVAKQVTLPQAAELRSALDAIQLQSRSSKDAPQDALTMAVSPMNVSAAGVNPNTSLAFQTAESKKADVVMDATTRPADADPAAGKGTSIGVASAPSELGSAPTANAAAEGSSVNFGGGGVNYSVVRTDAQAIELNAVQLEPSTGGNQALPALRAPATKPETLMAAVNNEQLPATAGPDGERFDFVIVLQPRAEAPATQPATTQPVVAPMP